ncbi:bile acid 7-alpha [Colletotrichum asianum]
MAHVSPEVALAISRQKARYARYADTKQWDKFDKEIGLPTAQYVYCGTGGQPVVLGTQKCVFESPGACAAWFGNFFSYLETLHNIGLGDFEQIAPDQVKAVFGFEDQLFSKQLGSWAGLRGGGFYYETWKLVDGEWYIQDLRMERTYQQATFLFKVGLVGASLLGFI